MALHSVARGLSLPIAGAPAQTVDGGPGVSRVALVADDYVSLRPAFHVAVGDRVQRGQLLFEDKGLPGVRHTAPAEGTVAAIYRGDRRAFESLVIELSDAERGGRGAQVRLSSFTGQPVDAIGDDGVRELLIESGLWTSLRARPFSRVANPAVRPRAIFVTAMDSEPLAPDVTVALQGREDDVEQGLGALATLTEGPVFLCTSDQFALPVPSVPRLRHERFAGPHPAGTAGVHIHTVSPAGRGRVVWHVGYQDLLAIGRLIRTGAIDTGRIIGLGGVAVRRPRLIRTRVGASIDEILQRELHTGEVRVISGSVLSGRTASGTVRGFLGRFHRQISAIFEDRGRAMMGWAAPGLTTFSATGAFLSRLLPRRSFAMTTSTHGSRRAIVPIGLYEQVLPFDLPATFLLKALVTHDVERAEQLGCLELDEEDLALCTFVCPSKIDYGPYLRTVLTTIEKEG